MLTGPLGLELGVHADRYTILQHGLVRKK